MKRKKHVSINTVRKNKTELEANGYTLVREGNTTGLSDGVVVLCETTGDEWDCIREIWRAWAKTDRHIHNVRIVAPEMTQK